MPIDPFHLDPDRHKPKVVQTPPLFHPLHIVPLALVLIAGAGVYWVWGDVTQTLGLLKLIAVPLGLILLWRLKVGWDSDGISGLWYAWHQPWGSSFLGDDPGTRDADPLTSALWWTGVGLVCCGIASMFGLLLR
jgi:hypothetical protein